MWIPRPLLWMEHDRTSAKPFIRMRIDVDLLDVTECERADDPRLHERNRQAPVDFLAAAIMAVREPKDVHLLPIVGVGEACGL